ncbi:MAG: anti-sigma factor family protein [Enterocloster sp.]
MTCREAERLVMPYINGSITDEELEEFLEHIDSCENCLEELEIYFTVDVGIRQLDEGTGTYNIKGALETALELSRQRIHTIHLLRTARYAVNTLCFWSLLMMLILQLRIWSDVGFLGL